MGPGAATNMGVKEGDNMGPGEATTRSLRKDHFTMQVADILDLIIVQSTISNNLPVMYAGAKYKACASASLRVAEYSLFAGVCPLSGIYSQGKVNTRIHRQRRREPSLASTPRPRRQKTTNFPMQYRERL